VIYLSGLYPPLFIAMRYLSIVQWRLVVYLFSPTVADIQAILQGKSLGFIAIFWRPAHKSDNLTAICKPIV
jgi:hypothetical protein